MILLYYLFIKGDEEQESRDSNMAWKSDLHGFYQLSRTSGFLHQFHDREQDDSEEGMLKHTFDTNDKLYEQELHGEKFSFVEGFDNSELFNDESDVKDVTDATLAQDVPLVFIQPPTPSHLSSRTTSSIGSSLSVTPEPDDSEVAFRNEEPRLASDVVEQSSEGSQDAQMEVLQHERRDGESWVLIESRQSKNEGLQTENVGEDKNKEIEEVVDSYGSLNLEEEIIVGMENHAGRLQEEIEDKKEKNCIEKEEIVMREEEENNEFISGGLGRNEEVGKWRSNVEDSRDNDMESVNEDKYGMEFVMDRRDEEYDEHFYSKEYENVLMKFEEGEENDDAETDNDVDDNDDTETDDGLDDALNFEKVATDKDSFDVVGSRKLSCIHEALNENESEATLGICNDITHRGGETDDDVTSLWYGRTPAYDNHDNNPVYDDNGNDTSNSVDHANNTLLTSWSEQQIKNEIIVTDDSDTITLGHRTDYSPTITWRTKSVDKHIDSVIDSIVDTDSNILQTSIGSATDLREILERSFQEELDGFEDEKDKEHRIEDGLAESIELRSLQGSRLQNLEQEKFLVDNVDKCDGVERYDDTTHYKEKDFLSDNGAEEDVTSKDEDLVESGKFTEEDDGDGGSSFNVENFEDFSQQRAIPGTFAEVDDAEFVSSWKPNAGLMKHGRFMHSMPDEVMICLEDLEAISLLQSVEAERVRMDTVSVIRRKIEETCRGIPIERIPPFVYSQWEELLRSLAEKDNALFREMQTEYEDTLMDMRSELDKLTKENLDLSRIATENNSSKLENELLRKQIGGLEEFVASLEKRIEGRANENAKLLEEIGDLRSASAVKENDLRVLFKNCENELKEAKSEAETLKKHAMNLENEIKVKEIENRRILLDNEKMKDEMQNDFENMNLNVRTLRNKLIDLQNENDTFRTANEADQTIIKHLEGKLQAANEDLAEVRTEKSHLLAELEGSKIREADMKKRQSVFEKEKGDLEVEKDKILEKSRKLQEEKLIIEKKLNEKFSTDMKNAEAMLQEIKSLESSLNSVRNEKSHVEDKYNNLKFELEREQLIKNRRKESSKIFTPEKKEGGRRPNDFEKEDGKPLTNSFNLLGQKYLKPFSNKSLSFEASESRALTPSATFLSGPENPIGISGGNYSHFSVFSGSPSSLVEVNSSEDSFSTLQSQSATQKNFGRNVFVNVSESEDSFDRKLKPVSPYETESTLQSKVFSSAAILQESDGESVNSYLDFPRDSAYFPSVMVIGNSASSSMGSESTTNSQHAPRHPGGEQIKHHAYSRLAEREDSKQRSRNMDWRQGNVDPKQFIGNVKHQNEDENSKSKSYSAEDTR